jgi:hypothetical protein
MGRKKISFENACNLFESNNCKLLYTKEEFNSFYVNTRYKIKYEASCGHIHNIQLRVFKAGTGKICPSCVYKQRSISLAKQQSNENKIKNNLIETASIDYLISNLENTFHIIKTFDSCNSDIIIKPKFIEENLWIGIQVKSTKTNNNTRRCYYFNIKKDYQNLLIICICCENKKMWGFENNEITHLKNTLQITSGVSKYNKFEITQNLTDYLLDKYKILNKFDSHYLLNQLSKTTLIEYNYRNLRMTKIKFITFIDNTNHGEVFDFKIGNKKVQEKVGTYIPSKNNKKCDYYQFNLSKCNGKYNKKIPYNKGDNDIYWFHCKDNKFYVIPEDILIKYGFIGKKTSIIISHKNKNKLWLNDYIFDYDDLEKDKDKLCKILL